MIAVIDVNHSFHKSFFIFSKWNKEIDLTNHKQKGVLMRKVVTDLMASVNKLYQSPEDVYFCFDSHTWRKNFCKEYKGGRGNKAEGFHEVINELYDIMTAKGFKTLKVEGAESDDCIAFIANTFPNEKIIISGDEDMHQLLDADVHVWNNNLQKPIIFTAINFSERKFLNVSHQNKVVNPKLSIFKKVMLGCTSDEVSPLIDKKGIGPKTIEKFFNSYPRLMESKNNSFLEEMIKNEFKYSRPDFQNKLSHNERLVKLDLNFLPPEINSGITMRLKELSSLEKVTNFSIEGVLSKTKYFL